MLIDPLSGTRIDEIAEDTYRISTPVPPNAGADGFSFNQYLVVDEAPLLFHTGMKGLYAPVRHAIESVLPVSRLRYIGLSHVESDECGALNDFLAAAPGATPVCSRVAAAISLGELSDRPPLGLPHGGVLSLGRHELVWMDAPHVPHNWETGYFHDRRTGTLFCGDLFVQGGHELPPLTTSDLLGPAEAFRRAEPATGLPPSWSLSAATGQVLGQLAALRPSTLACMHGSAWQGRGETAAAMLHGLAEAVIGTGSSAPSSATVP